MSGFGQRSICRTCSKRSRCADTPAKRFQENKTLCGACRCRGLQERRPIANRTPKREPPWETARSESEDRSGPSGGLWRAHRRGRAPSGYLDIWSFDDSDTKFVQLVNRVPNAAPMQQPILPLASSFLRRCPNAFERDELGCDIGRKSFKVRRLDQGLFGFSPCGTKANASGHRFDQSAISQSIENIFH